jgi:hypothetical protein
VTLPSRLPLFVPAALLALGGCVAGDGFPSLAQRPAELNVSIEEPVYPAVDVPSDPAVRARIDELRRLAAEGDRGFAAALGPTEAVLARAGPSGSESWVEAQQALSRLETTREPTMRALAELDRLVITRAEAPTNSEDFAAIHAAIAEVEALAASQQQRWDRLRARLPGVA